MDAHKDVTTFTACSALVGCVYGVLQFKIDVIPKEPHLRNANIWRLPPPHWKMHSRNNCANIMTDHAGISANSGLPNPKPILDDFSELQVPVWPLINQRFNFIDWSLFRFFTPSQPLVTSFSGSLVVSRMIRKKLTSFRTCFWDFRQSFVSLNIWSAGFSKKSTISGKQITQIKDKGGREKTHRKRGFLNVFASNKSLYLVQTFET